MLSYEKAPSERLQRGFPPWGTLPALAKADVLIGAQIFSGLASLNDWSSLGLGSKAVRCAPPLSVVLRMDHKVC